MKLKNLIFGSVTLFDGLVISPHLSLDLYVVFSLESVLAALAALTWLATFVEFSALVVLPTSVAMAGLAHQLHSILCVQRIFRSLICWSVVKVDTTPPLATNHTM